METTLAKENLKKKLLVRMLLMSESKIVPLVGQWQQTSHVIKLDYL